MTWETNEYYVVVQETRNGRYIIQSLRWIQFYETYNKAIKALKELQEEHPKRNFRVWKITK